MEKSEKIKFIEAHKKELLDFWSKFKRVDKEEYILCNMKMINDLYSNSLVLDNRKITCSRDFAEIIREDIVNEKEEKFIYLLLSEDKKTIFKGFFDGLSDRVFLDSRKMILSAIHTNCKYMLIGHNHPSGNVQPSQLDIIATKKIYQGLLFINVLLLDHIIITKDSYYSFYEKDLLK
jgi:DNA repair protein RadC